MIFKPIPGFNGDYEISDSGLIFSIKFGGPKFLIDQPEIHGYRRISLGNMPRKCYLIHRLVAMTWLNTWDPLLQVNHINGIKTDNRVENLEMCTNAENILHSYRVLGNKGGTAKSGEDHHLTVLSIKDVKEIRELFELGLTNKQIAETYPVCAGTIRNHLSHCSPSFYLC